MIQILLLQLSKIFDIFKLDDFFSQMSQSSEYHIKASTTMPLK